MSRFGCVVVTSLLCACGGGSESTVAPHAGEPPRGSPDAGERATDAPPAPGSTDAGAAACAGQTPYCTAFDTRSFCVDGPSGPTWLTEKCAGGCEAGTCAPAKCSDECALGETGPGGTCRLWSMAAGAVVDPTPATSLHDRARDYDAWLRKNQMPTGGVITAHYTDATLATFANLDGTADSALWTGTALAAQAFRLRATGAADAEARVRTIAATLHAWLGMTGSPGYLARFAVEENNPNAATVDCSKNHCGASFEGKTYRWKGKTSRDQYTGVMLGLALAYEAVHDEPTRAMIRADVLTIVEELMKRRLAVPARVIFQGLTFDVPLELENVIMAPVDERVDGRVLIDLDGDPELQGARDFMPDYGAVLGQLPLVGGIKPSIPRPDSTPMLGTFFGMALAMTEGRPELTVRRQAIADYYASHADSWLETTKLWSYLKECGDSYFAIHIAYIMAFAWTHLEQDPARHAKIRDEVLDQRGWSLVKGHKNPYFAFLWGATRPNKPAEMATALDQLAEFPVGPRVNVPIDRRGQYPHDAACKSNGEDQAAKSVAVDVKDRAPQDFMWQRHPWALFSSGNPKEVFPGVDYVVAYWAARHFGFAPDDRSGTCARWIP